MLDVLPDRRLRESVKAHPLPFAVGRNRPELLLTKDRDDPVHVEPTGGEHTLVLNGYDLYHERYAMCHKRISHTHYYIGHAALATLKV